jgi:hypothetical protein
LYDFGALHHGQKVIGVLIASREAQLSRRLFIHTVEEFIIAKVGVHHSFSMSKKRTMGKAEIAALESLLGGGTRKRKSKKTSACPCKKGGLIHTPFGAEKGGSFFAWLNILKIGLRNPQSASRKVCQCVTQLSA